MTEHITDQDVAEALQLLPTSELQKWLDDMLKMRGEVDKSIKIITSELEAR